MKGLRVSVAAGSAALMLGGCATAPPSRSEPIATGCETAAARISFDVETAPLARCSVLGERAFAILVTPEHVPPINPSPYYAFRYQARGPQPVSVRLDYLGADHRYPPKLVRGSEILPVPVEVSEDGRSARLVLPPGDGVVAAQPPFGASLYARFNDRLAALAGADRVDLGHSVDGRPITGIRFGPRSAPALVIFLGRQHPPETTGAIALEAFVLEIAAQTAAGRTGQVQFLTVAELNPDGVARGHWRANRGGKDLNRDWGDFSQPETRAVKAWLDALPASIRPAAMLDFHSTSRNLFYVQSETETDEREEAFLTGWLGGQQSALPFYAFAIERRNANPGLGTAKNWFHQVYDIPAFTYEVGDEVDPETVRRAARALARSYLVHLGGLLERRR